MSSAAIERLDSACAAASLFSPVPPPKFSVYVRWFSFLLFCFFVSECNTVGKEAEGKVVNKSEILFVSS